MGLRGRLSQRRRQVPPLARLQINLSLVDTRVQDAAATVYSSDRAFDLLVAISCWWAHASQDGCENPPSSSDLIAMEGLIAALWHGPQTLVGE